MRSWSLGGSKKNDGTEPSLDQYSVGQNGAGAGQQDRGAGGAGGSHAHAHDKHVLR
jgi:hypothetical protein